MLKVIICLIKEQNGDLFVNSRQVQPPLSQGDQWIIFYQSDIPLSSLVSKTFEGWRWDICPINVHQWLHPELIVASQGKKTQMSLWTVQERHLFFVQLLSMRQWGERASRCGESWRLLLWEFVGERMGRISQSVLKRRAIIAHSWRGNTGPDAPLFPPSMTIHVKENSIFICKEEQGICR